MLTEEERIERRRQQQREYYQRVRERKLAYQNEYYQKNGEQVRRRSSISNKAQRERLRKEAIVLKGGKCMDCGVKDDRLLQFHHRPGTMKVSEVMCLAKSTRRFWEEVAKCDLVCANDHLIRHSEGR